MVKAIALVLFKNDNLLLLNRDSNRLPIIRLSDEEVIEEKLPKWLDENINLKDAKFLKKEGEVIANGYSITIVFIDASDNDISIVGSDFVFENCNYIYSTNPVEEIIIEGAMQVCKLNNFNKNISEKLEKILTEKKKFKGENTKKKTMIEIDTNKSLWLILGAIFAGFMLSNFLFSYMGISVSIFYGYLIALFFLVNGVKNKSYIGYFLVVAGFILACTFGIFTNEVFRALNTLFVPISIFTGFILLTYGDIKFKFISLINAFIERVVGNSLLHGLSLFKVTKNIVGNKKSDSNANNNYRDIFKGVLISVPVLIVLILLLSGADEMFSYYINNISDHFRVDNFSDYVNKIITFIVSIFLIFGLYYSLAVDEFHTEDNKAVKKSFKEITVLTLLICISALYLIFTKIQISYLYLGKELPDGYDFAEYARSGFFQLVFLVVITLALIVFLKLKTKEEKEGIYKLLKVGYTLITVLTFNMSISAIYKMNLYIEAFGYTRLRLLVQVFTVFLCGILLLLILFIWRDKEIFKPIVVLATILYLTLNYVNIDNYIVKKNIQIMTANNEIDIYYLTNLSLDAYKAMTEGEESGKIPSEEYYNWINRNRNNQLHWYSYNYFNNIRGK